MTDSPTLPDADLLIASGCAHCPSVLNALSEMLKKGEIGRLSVTNLSIYPDAGAERGARAVPWLQLGPFVLEGSRTPSELREWAQRATSSEGMAEYISELLENQKLPDALKLVRNESSLLPLLINLIGDLETPMGVRIGVGAVFEELAETGEFTPLIALLAKLLQAEQPQVRADAAYYLGLGDAAQVRPLLAPLLDDPDHEVREIVREALEAEA